MPDTIRAWRLTGDEAVPDHESTRHLPPCVVVTGRTAQDVTRLLREPTDEDIVLAARVIREILRDRPITHPMAERVARAVLTAYRSPEEADRA